MTAIAQSKATDWQPWLAAGGRVFLAAIFIISGISKLGDPAGTAGYIASVGIPAPMVAAWGAIAIELVGGVALIAGYRVRITALALALFSLATALLFHNDFADQMQSIMFMKNIAIVGGLLQVMAFGAGRYGIDRS
ncbi:MAG: DoxX family protein [Sphingopyxis sp.]|nr:DoxX family protein [Sphingopyxis sp.]